ncbi:MAG: hypothetical protein IH971_06465 [Candidatus Marinimicrobia bacterium]|nr:hypothetical protein [Candidatus Neomarinimicrobiota bacterium]
MKQERKPITVLVPLHHFEWEGNSFPFSDNFLLTRDPNLPDFGDLEGAISNVELEDSQGIPHWLRFVVNSNDLTPAEIVTTFLLALWLAVPSKTQANYYFEFARSEKRFTRILERFQWVEPYAAEVIETQQLETAKAYWVPLQTIWKSRKRLWDSLALTAAGCMSKRWQVAIICFAAALESILTYDKAPGITRRLASSFACLTQTTKNARDSAFQEFCKIYGVRSDIMHGRIHDIPYGKRLELVNNTSNLLRSLWRVVLLAPTVMEGLDKGDKGRKVFLKGIQGGYKVPHV